MKNKKSISNFLILTLTIIILLETPSTHAQAEERVNIEVLNHCNYVETVGSVVYLVTVGEVRNNLTTNVKSLIVDATYYDDTNNSIGTSYSYAVLDILEPQMKSPFTLYLHINSSQEAPNISAKLRCTGSKTNEKPPPLPQIENLTSYTDENGYFIVCGEIRNVGPSEAYDIGIFCSYYGADETELLGLSRTFITSVIKVDHSAPFKISSKPFKINLASYEVLAVARYKPKMVTRLELLLLLATVFTAFIFYMKKCRGW